MSSWRRLLNEAFSLEASSVMSQLSGLEQAEIVSLIAQHAGSVNQLEFSLFHGELIDAGKFPSGRSLFSVTATVVRDFSNQHKVVAMVEAFLAYPDGLNGSCPPIEAWLERMRPILAGRRGNPASEPAAMRPPWRGVSVEEAVLQFPEGPNVREPLPLFLIQEFASSIHDMMARTLVGEANRLRTLKDPGDERAKQVNTTLLTHPMAGMLPFVAGVLDDARRRGPRTVAAVLLVFDRECAKEVKDQCDLVLWPLLSYC